MNEESLQKEETQIEYLSEPYSTTNRRTFGQELMKCGKVFLCFISQDFVFYCGLCEENSTRKYTIFDEFANHIKQKHVKLWNSDSDNLSNDAPSYFTELQDDPIDTNEKEAFQDQILDEFEKEYLHSDQEEKYEIEEPSNELIDVSKDDVNVSQEIQKPQLFVLQWPENQVLQLIDLYREQECLWNVKSILYHKSKIKIHAYNEILQKFKKLNPNVLKNVDSLQTAIQELHEFLDDVDKEQHHKTTSNSYNEKIYKSLHFLKNVSKSNSNQIAETTSTCDIFNSNSSETEDFNVEDMKDINMCSTEASLLACHICRVTFENTKDLENHLNDLSSNSQKKICHICGAEFTDRSNFITHMRRHKKEKPFGCKDCSKCFVTSTELNTHIRVHSNEKAFMFMCETCGLQFRYQNHLETHKKLHFEPLLECSVCNKKFLIKRQLAYHQRKHGFEEKAKCLICNNIYRNKDSLLRHERKIHNIRKRKSKQ